MSESEPESKRKKKIDTDKLISDNLLKSEDRIKDRYNLLQNMIADDKKSIDIARAVITDIKTTDDDYTDLSDKQIIYLSILETIAEIINDNFLRLFCKRFKTLRKSRGRKDRQEAVKMVQALREESEGLQSKFKDMLGVGGV